MDSARALLPPIDVQNPRPARRCTRPKPRAETRHPSTVHTRAKMADNTIIFKQARGPQDVMEVVNIPFHPKSKATNDNLSIDSATADLRPDFFALSPPISNHGTGGSFTEEKAHTVAFESQQRKEHGGPSILPTWPWVTNSTDCVTACKCIAQSLKSGIWSGQNWLLEGFYKSVPATDAAPVSSSDF